MSAATHCHACSHFHCVWVNEWCLWPPTLGGADQTSYIARSIGIGKPELEAAFDQCRTKYECVCIYTDPPPGRSTFMINMSRPFDPHAAVDGYEDYGY